jgi:hypothetical protein
MKTRCSHIHNEEKPHGGEGEGEVGVHTYPSLENILGSIHTKGKTYKRDPGYY